MAVRKQTKAKTRKKATRKKAAKKTPTKRKKKTKKGTKALAKVGGGTDLSTYLQEIGDDDDVEVAVKEGNARPYLGFYWPKSKGAHEIVEEIGAQKIGAPYLKVDGDYYSANSLNYVVLAGYSYWATFDNDNAITWCSLEEQPWGTKINDVKVKACAGAVVLMLPGTSKAGRLPEELRPAVLAMADCRGTKVGVVEQAKKAIVESKTDEFAKEHPEIVASVGVKFRQVLRFNVIQKPKRGPDSFAYAITTGVANPIDGVSQVEAIMKFFSDEENRALLEEYKAELWRRKDEIAVAAKQFAAGVAAEEEEWEDDDLDDDLDYEDEEEEDEEDEDLD